MFQATNWLTSPAGMNQDEDRIDFPVSEQLGVRHRPLIPENAQMLKIICDPY